MAKKKSIHQLGGLACLKKHGKEFYRKIGRKGAKALKAKLSAN